MAPSGQRTPLGEILLRGGNGVGQDFFPITRREQQSKPSIEAARRQHERVVVPKQAQADRDTGERGEESEQAPARRGRAERAQHPKPRTAPERGQVEIRRDFEPLNHHPPCQRVDHRPAPVIGERGEAMAEPRAQQTLPSEVGPA